MNILQNELLVGKYKSSFNKKYSFLESEDIEFKNKLIAASIWLVSIFDYLGSINSKHILYWEAYAQYHICLWSICEWLCDFWLSQIEKVWESSEKKKIKVFLLTKDTKFKEIESLNSLKSHYKDKESIIWIYKKIEQEKNSNLSERSFDSKVKFLNKNSYISESMYEKIDEIRDLRNCVHLSKVRVKSEIKDITVLTYIIDQLTAYILKQNKI